MGTKRRSGPPRREWCPRQRGGRETPRERPFGHRHGGSLRRVEPGKGLHSYPRWSTDSLGDCFGPSRTSARGRLRRSPQRTRCRPEDAVSQLPRDLAGGSLADLGCRGVPGGGLALHPRGGGGRAAGVAPALSRSEPPECPDPDPSCLRDPSPCSGWPRFRRAPAGAPDGWCGSLEGHGGVCG